MRLLRRAEDGTIKLGSIALTSHASHKSVPYAILSHTWAKDEDEASYQDFQTDRWLDKPLAVKKIQYCADQAKRDGLEYFWIDTCCIDKTSSSELQEAINSMFRWYKSAKVCYAYLSDVSVPESCPDLSLESVASFKQSRWFTRGWTLQELLAPSQVLFFSAEWNLMGDRRALGRHIAEVTGIPPQALSGLPLSQFPTDTRLSWGAKRRTKREEDAAYSLFGIFSVSMPLLYGEGKTRAMRRLNAEIKKEAQYLPSTLVPSGEWSGYVSSGAEESNLNQKSTRKIQMTSAPSGVQYTTKTPPRDLYTPQHFGSMSRDRTQSQNAYHSPPIRSAMAPPSIRFGSRRRRSSDSRNSIVRIDLDRAGIPNNNANLRPSEPTIIVSCNHNASELSVSSSGKVQTYRPQYPLLPVNGDREAAARSIKAFVQEKLGPQLADRELALHWAVPLMTTDANKASLRTASVSAGFSPHSRVLSQVEAVSSPSIFKESNKYARSSDPARTVRFETLDQPIETAATNMMVLLCNDTGCEMATYALSGKDGEHREIALARAVAAGWAELEIELRQWMKQQFGEAFDSLDPDLTAANSQFMISFEQHVSGLAMMTSSWKPAFLPLHLVCNGANRCYDEAGYVVLRGEDMLFLIEPLAEKITAGMTSMINELKSQNETLTEIILNGNFIDIPYIKSTIEHHARKLTSDLVPITYQPDSSVTVGAIIREVENVKPKSTKALRHYGCVYAMPFREGIDPPRKAFFDTFSQQKLCNLRANWLIRKGQDITPDTVAESHNVFTCDISKPIPAAELKFISSSMEQPPEWSDSPGIDVTSGIISTQFTRDEVMKRFKVQNGRHGLTSVVKLSMGSDLGVLQAERVEVVSGRTMGNTTIRFE